MYEAIACMYVYDMLPLDTYLCLIVNDYTSCYPYKCMSDTVKNALQSMIFKWSKIVRYC